MSTMERNQTSARRESLLGDQPGAFARARYVRITPMKARRVVDMVRGMDVESAATVLAFAPQAAAETVGKILADALNGGGNGPDLDAVLDALPGRGEHGRGLAHDLASRFGHDVPNGDTGETAGFTAPHAMPTMDDMAMHQDAAPAHA